jgi:hypothetical protein
MEIFAGFAIWLMAPIIVYGILMLGACLLIAVAWLMAHWVYVLGAILAVCFVAFFVAFCDQRARNKGWK